jgi:hypothetical protein
LLCMNATLPSLLMTLLIMDSHTCALHATHCTAAAARNLKQALLLALGCCSIEKLYAHTDTTTATA